MNLKQRIEELASEQPWMYRFRLDEDILTPGPRIKGKKNAMKVKTIQALQLDGKRVLDVGCGEGLFSFYMEASGALVTGLEINEARYKKAEFVKEILGKDKVNFVLIDAVDTSFWENSEKKYDFGFCFSLIHRVSDPFNLIAQLASCCETLVFEWKAPEGFISRRFSLAFHETQGGLDPKNIKTRDSLLSAEQIMDSGLERPYWTMTSGALVQILKDFGFSDFQILKVSRMNILRVAYAYIDLFRNVFFGGNESFSWKRSRRLIMICSKSEKIDLVGRIPREIRQHNWDATCA